MNGIPKKCIVKYQLLKWISTKCIFLYVLHFNVITISSPEVLIFVGLNIKTFEDDIVIILKYKAQEKTYLVCFFQILNFNNAFFRNLIYFIFHTFHKIPNLMESGIPFSLWAPTIRLGVLCGVCFFFRYNQSKKKWGCHS